MYAGIPILAQVKHCNVSVNTGTPMLDEQSRYSTVMCTYHYAIQPLLKYTIGLAATPTGAFCSYA